MTSRRSLSKKKGAAYSFFSGLSTAIVPAILIFAMQTLIMAVFPLINFIENNQNAKEDISGTQKYAKDIWQFLVFGEANIGKIMVFPVLIILGVLAIMTAVFLFRFICDKRTVNIYYSLGIKRSTLFLSKYFAGALLICTATALAVTLSYTANLIFIGPSWQLSVVLLHFYCGLSLFLLICYTAASVVFASVGTVSEAIVYSAALIFAPTIFFFGLQQICTAFLRSSVFNQSIVEFTEQFSWGADNTQNMIQQFAAFNPVLFFSGELEKYAVALKSGTKITLPGIKADFSMPDMLIHIPWFIITAALVVLAVFLFKRLKAENCGFLNTNKVFSNLLIFEICLAVFTFWLPQLKYKDLLPIVLAGTGTAFVCYFLIEIFLKRNFKAVMKTVYKFAAHMAVIGIICTIAATGAFGYEKRIPDINKITAASVAMPVYNDHLTISGIETGSYYADGTAKVNFFWTLREIPEMTDRADIEKLLAFHKGINNANQSFNENGMDIFIRYELKNGKEMRRKLRINDKQLMSRIFTLYDTKAGKQALYNLMYKERTQEKLDSLRSTGVYENRTEIAEYCFGYEWSDVIARTPSLCENRTLKLTADQFYALKDCVYKDLSAKSGNEIFNSSYSQLGVLSFKVKPELMNPDDQGMIAPPEEMPEGDYIPEESIYKDLSYAPYDINPGADTFNRGYNVIITADMQNTLGYLGSIGYKDCFTSEMEIEAVSFIKCDYDAFKAYDYYTTNISPDFFAYPLEQAMFDNYRSTEEFFTNFQSDRTENVITDKEQINKLIPLLCLHRFTYDEGYYTLVKYKNSNAFSMCFIPERWAPDFVRNFNYTTSERDFTYASTR